MTQEDLIELDECAEMIDLGVASQETEGGGEGNGEGTAPFTA